MVGDLGDDQTPATRDQVFAVITDGLRPRRAA
jgi:hypothetical protein